MNKVMENAILESPFLKACLGEKTDYTPVWFMRQAGRYMDCYLKDKAKFKSFLEFCKHPETLAKVTIEAQQVLNVDAAILFSDLPLLLEAMGLKLSYSEGPLIEIPIRSPKDIEKLQPQKSEEMLFVADTIRLINQNGSAGIPLIGFSGAPFTLASYAIEGKGSKNYYHLKHFMMHEPKAWHALMEKMMESIIYYLQMQIDAGVHCVQLFDSWVGCLSPHHYETFALPYTKGIISSLKGQVPIIYFGTGAGSFMNLMSSTEADVIGFDWQTPLFPLWDDLKLKAVQGNLDPLSLCGPIDFLKKEVDLILNQVKDKSGYIFNLGHGIIPQTPVENVVEITSYIHEQSKKFRI